MTLRYRLAGGVLAAVIALIAVFLLLMQPVAAQSGLPRRGVVPMVASDGIYTSSDVPPPDPSYCANAGGGSAPPSGIFGALTIGGVQAPIGTLVQVSFNGKVGPGKRTTAAGGYNIIFDTGTAASCSNSAGAPIAILVNGQPFATGKLVGDDVLIGYRFDIAVP